MNSCKLTAFGLCVKTELLRQGKNQRWLEAEVSRDTGLFVDSGYMYKILTGRRSAPKIKASIEKILSLAPDHDADATA